MSADDSTEIGAFTICTISVEITNSRIQISDAIKLTLIAPLTQLVANFVCIDDANPRAPIMLFNLLECVLGDFFVLLQLSQKGLYFGKMIEPYKVYKISKYQIPTSSRWGTGRGQRR